MPGMRIAAEQDDAQRFGVDIVLQRGDLKVIVFNHGSDNHCLTFWTERTFKRPAQAPFTARHRVTATPQSFLRRRTPVTGDRLRPSATQSLVTIIILPATEFTRSPENAADTGNSVPRSVRAAAASVRATRIARAGFLACVICSVSSS